jgi:hypothetical protein
VGGYLLQRGISFLSAKYGLAFDMSSYTLCRALRYLQLLQNVVGWEIVAPNGTIIHVDATTRPDLAVTLRGSGS